MRECQFRYVHLPDPGVLYLGRHERVCVGSVHVEELHVSKREDLVLSIGCAGHNIRQREEMIRVGALSIPTSAVATYRLLLIATDLTSLASDAAVASLGMRTASSPHPVARCWSEDTLLGFHEVSSAPDVCLCANDVHGPLEVSNGRANVEICFMVLEHRSSLVTHVKAALLLRLPDADGGRASCAHVQDATPLGAPLKPMLLDQARIQESIDNCRA